MSEQPTVCCICLTKDRPEMLARAVRSFQAQTYENKRLLIYDTGELSEEEFSRDGVYYEWQPQDRRLSIGEIRNQANDFTNPRCLNAVIIAHWDDDDWSHPQRLTEQVALLQASGADCVGYSDMLFWRAGLTTVEARDTGEFIVPRGGEAWLYLGPQKALGTSLCYWRSTWERKPFPDQPRPGFATGEDVDWIRGLNLASVSSLSGPPQCMIEDPADTINIAPRMVAAIHGRNTSGCYKLMAGSDSWRRVPEWDSHCRARMGL